MMESRSHRSKTHLETPAPAMIAPDAPEDFGAGRRCGQCNARVNRYASLGVGEKRPTCYRCRQRKVDEMLADALLQAELTGASLGSASLDTKLHSLKAWRLKRAMSQRQLARAVGTHAAYISQLERGVNGSGEVLAGRLADALGVSVQELREEQKTEEKIAKRLRVSQ